MKKYAASLLLLIPILTWANCTPGHEDQVCPKAGVNYMYQQAGLVGQPVNITITGNQGGAVAAGQGNPNPCPANSVLVAVIHNAINGGNRTTVLQPIQNWTDCQVIPIIGGVQCGGHAYPLTSLPDITYTCQAIGLDNANWIHN